MLGRLLGTLGPHQVSHTATPSHMSGPKVGNLSGPVAVETAEVSEFEYFFGSSVFIFYYPTVVGEQDHDFCLCS